VEATPLESENIIKGRGDGLYKEILHGGGQRAKGIIYIPFLLIY